MGSDMVAALPQATVDGCALFGQNNNGLPGDGSGLMRSAGRSYSPGEVVQTTYLAVPQVRKTWTVLGVASAHEWGYCCGVNERGLAVGQTVLHTRHPHAAFRLTGSDVVRLVLERAGSACQAVELAAQLISRHGQGVPAADGEGGQDASFLIVDGREGYLLEACGDHWGVQRIGPVKAVVGTSLLRQDWDRLSAGLSDLAIERGWWPDDGRKLDFAEAVGRWTPGQEADLRRWVRMTTRLEESSGQLEHPSLRRLLREEAEALSPLTGSASHPERPSGGAPWTTLASTWNPYAWVTGVSWIAQLQEDPLELPTVWCAFGSPSASVYFPLSLAGELPPALGKRGEKSCSLWRRLVRWQADSRHDPRLRAALRAGLAGLQERFDQDNREFVAEVGVLRRRGELAEMSSLATSYMQYHLEAFEELDRALLGRRAASGPPDARQSDEELALEFSHF